MIPRSFFFGWFRENKKYLDEDWEDVKSLLL